MVCLYQKASDFGNCVDDGGYLAGVQRAHCPADLTPLMMLLKKPILVCIERLDDKCFHNPQEGTSRGRGVLAAASESGNVDDIYVR